MFDYSKKCGFESEFVSKDYLHSVVETLKKFDPTDVPEGLCYGVDYKHPNFEWFDQGIFNLFKKYTRRKDLKLIFGMYADFHSSFKVHRDIKTLPEENKQNKHFASFLLPVSVDNDADKCNLNCTYVFENAYLLEPAYNQDWHNNVEQNEITPYFQLSDTIQWGNPGSLIWWNSIYPHGGAVLPNSAGFSTKQMIVLHTYV